MQALRELLNQTKSGVFATNAFTKNVSQHCIRAIGGEVVKSRPVHLINFDRCSKVIALKSATALILQIRNQARFTTKHFLLTCKHLLLIFLVGCPAAQMPNRYANDQKRVAKNSEKWYFSITMKTELVTTLKRQATKLLKELREEKEPVLITEHGKPSAYLVDVDHFEQIQKKLKLLEGLARGEKAILEDRIVSHKDAKKRMARWLE
jgi:prevent-host-death family protein